MRISHIYQKYIIEYISDISSKFVWIYGYMPIYPPDIIYSESIWIPKKGPYIAYISHIYLKYGNMDIRTKNAYLSDIYVHISDRDASCSHRDVRLSDSLSPTETHLSQTLRWRRVSLR